MFIPQLKFLHLDHNKDLKETCERWRREIEANPSFLQNLGSWIVQESGLKEGCFNDLAFRYLFLWKK